MLWLAGHGHLAAGRHLRGGYHVGQVLGWRTFAHPVFADVERTVAHIAQRAGQQVALGADDQEGRRAADRPHVLYDVARREVVVDRCPRAKA